ncbi:MAG: hypothetical protein WCJ13_11890, partial [Coriobacteriia bacterium]
MAITGSIHGIFIGRCSKIRKQNVKQKLNMSDIETKFRLKERSIDLNNGYDVIVVGGGPSGCAAAAASAR